MAKITKKMQAQIRRLQDAANAGLPLPLREFILLSVFNFERMENICSGKQAQRYLDTLTDLIDVKVNLG